MGHFPHQKRIADHAKPCQSTHLTNGKIRRDALGLKQKQCVCVKPLPPSEAVGHFRNGASLLWRVHTVLSVTDCMCERTCAYKPAGQGRRADDTHRTIVWTAPGFVNYIPFEMNRARRRVIAPDYQQTELSSGLAANQAELSAGANSLFALVRPRAPHYDWVTPATPNVKMSRGSASAPLPQPPPYPPPRSPSRSVPTLTPKKISQKPTNSCIFQLSIQTATAEHSPCPVHENDANESLAYTNDRAC